MNIDEAHRFEIFPWNENFETGIELIDQQHKQLVSLLNKLAFHLANHSTFLILNQIFDELTQYADYHFKSEEKIWSRYFQNDEWYDNHESSHQSFIKKISAMQNGDPFDEVIHELVIFLSQWLINHILGADMRMAKAIKAIDSGCTLAEAKVQTDYASASSMQPLIDTVLSMYRDTCSQHLDLLRERAKRKRAEEALIATENKFNLMMNETGEYAWDWDIEKGEKLLSESSNKTGNIGINILHQNRGQSKIHPEDIEQAKAAIQLHLDGKTEFYENRHRVLRDNNSWSWVLTRGKVVSRDKHGNALRMIGTHSDITVRELASLIYTNSSQAMFITDSRHNILNINPAFTRITGYCNKETIGKNPGFLASGKHDKAFFDEIMRSIKEHGYWTGEIWNRKKNGEIYCALISINSSTDHNGSVDHYIALFSDITDRKTTEKQLIASQKEAEEANQAKSIFLSRMSHELRTPLNAILGFAQIQEADLKTGKSGNLKACNEHILEAGYHLLALVDDILDIVNIEQPEFDTPCECIELNPILQQSIMLVGNLARQKNITLLCEKSPYIVDSNTRRLTQILINLLSNAIKYNKKDGEVSITTDKKGDGYIEIAVRDTGIGIEPAHHNEIFQPFHRLPYARKNGIEGAGIGLSLTKLLVQQLKGHISFDSIPGEGTCFKVLIPSA